MHASWLIVVTIALLGQAGEGTADPPEPAASQPAAPPAKRPQLRLNTTRGWNCRLLVRPSDVEIIKLHCGTTAGASATSAREEIATHVAEFRRLKAYVDANLAGPVELGGLYPIAFMHLATGQPGVADPYTECVERELKRRRDFVLEYDDVAAALDWCGDAIEPEVVSATADGLMRAFQPLRVTDNPFEHALLNPKLCSFASAVALRDAFEPGTDEADRVKEILTAGTVFLERTLLPTVLQLRGTAPSPSIRADFEADIIFAAELWQSLDAAAWEKFRGVVDDSLDWYFWSDTQWPGLSAGVLYDMGTSSPLEPGQGVIAIAPGVTEILSRRTGGAVAGYYAASYDREHGVRNLRDAQRAWLRILHGRTGLHVADRERAPLARRMGDGWVVMRGDWGPGATVLAFDAEQAYWLPRQHLDAGQFQIIRKGRLAIDSGDDVAFEATRMRGGEQRLGKDVGEFDTYATATVAHNCVVAIDPREATVMVGKQWLFLGNQRRPKFSRGPSKADDGNDKRALGKLTAFETNPRFSFATSELARAYDPRTVRAAERSILFIHDGLIVVVDRVETTTPNIKVATLFHLPHSPQVGDQPLNNEFRRRGEGQSAGEWVYPADKHWLMTQDGGGKLYIRSIQPRERKWHIVGGPAETMSIPRGPSAGRPYVGGGERGFEYWLTPAMLAGGANAWYRLGSPGALGAAFGSGGGWGRLECESLESGTSHTFVNVLVPCDQAQEGPPKLIVQNFRDKLVLKSELRGRQYTIELRPGESPPGRVEAIDALTKETFTRALPTQVEPADAVPPK